MSQLIRHLKLGGAEIKVFSDSTAACAAATGALSIAIPTLVEARGNAVLGLATGATPEPVYAGLVRAYRSGQVSFSRVSTYNLDEYYPISPLDPNSYRSYMHRHLFAHVDLAPDRAHVLDGTVPQAFSADHAADFDRWIAADEGIDVQILGIGRNGHIGFNEPCELTVEEALALPTRVVDLHPTTIADAAKDFGGEDLVPRHALTMGIATILAARSILVLAFGEKKAPAVARSLKGPISPELPGSLLQTVPGRVTWLIDRAAASEIL